MQKKGQLGIIEFKFFMCGLILGLAGGFVLVFLGTKKIIPFKIPLVCGFFGRGFFGKKGQLGMIEFEYFIGGFIVGIICALIITYLATIGVIPFKIPLICG